MGSHKKIRVEWLDRLLGIASIREAEPVGGEVRLKVVDIDHTLCAKCRSGQVIKNNGVVKKVICTWHSESVFLDHPVTSCSVFEDKSTTSLYSMEKIAWIVETKGDRVVGFRPPKKDEY